MPARQVWHIPGFVRPWDEAEILARLHTTSARFVVLRFERGNPAVPDPCAWVDPSPYTETFCAALRPRLLEHSRIDADTWVYTASPP